MSGNPTSLRTFLPPLPTVFAFVLALFFSSCSLLGLKKSKHKDESLKMVIVEKTDPVNLFALKAQQIPTYASRGSQARGLPIGLMGGAVSLATNVIKQVIAEEQKKYVAEYSFGLTDLYFYDQLTQDSPFDPIGLQFDGFRIIRLNGGAASHDTALIAEFELDNSNPYDIINNSVFRLKVRRLDIRNLKAKMAPGSKGKANLDVEITVNTSYVNQNGQLFDNVELGKFYLFLRGAPVGQSEEVKQAYFKKLKGTRLDGRSFIVPRSFGYRIGSSGRPEAAYSQGAYSLLVKVKESTKDTFVNKVITDNSDKVIEMLGKEANKKLK